jgi:hypothetical protein
MLPENIPTCPHCGSDTFRPGGGHFGGPLTQQGFTCDQCEASVQLLSHRAGAVMAYISRDACTVQPPPPEYPDLEPTLRFPTAYGDWANKVLLPTWRDRAAKLEAHKGVEWRKWLAEVFYVAHPELKGRTREDSDYVLFDDNRISYHDCPPEAQKLVDDTFGGRDRPHQVGVYLELPDDLIVPLYPPAMPEIEGVVVLYREGAAWTFVDPEHSQTLEVPEDPILANNREFFDDVWARVGEAIERPFPPRAETKNQYGGIEPWYAFQIGNAVVVAGWRKRVVSIKVELETGFPTEDIHTLAAADNTTYQAWGPLITRTAEDFEAIVREQEPNLEDEEIAKFVAIHRERHPTGEMTREGGWKDDRSTAMKLEVHAWGKDKTIEYLTTLCRTLILCQEAA